MSRIPFGIRITTEITIIPRTNMWIVRNCPHTVSEINSIRNAPNTGPHTVPAPPSSIITKAFIEISISKTVAGSMKLNQYANTPPVRPVKKAEIAHDFIITDLSIPKDEKDPLKMRENTIRKGKIIRRINVDGRNIVKESKFEA